MLACLSHKQTGDSTALRALTPGRKSDLESRTLPASCSSRFGPNVRGNVNIAQSARAVKRVTVGTSTSTHTPVEATASSQTIRRESHSIERPDLRTSLARVRCRYVSSPQGAAGEREERGARSEEESPNQRANQAPFAEHTQ
ncbi:hypothetical protein CBOM_07995 [Ceraceosorus bombacis]|uniref:Uncharacterized protein n=1 Tax=Ceraceosorus bombacis TaxID=401625 RepID=A0A0P1BJ90_9BASI|nr:hypothetical protein CBOM_07995 [Ceraceosorus bombacis]